MIPIPIPSNKQSNSRAENREEIVVDNSEQRTISGYGQQFNLNFLFNILNQIIQRKLSVFGTSGGSSYHNNPNKNIEFSVKLGGNGHSNGAVESNPQVSSSGSSTTSGSGSGSILSSLNPLNYINPSAIISSLAPTVLNSLAPSLNLFGRNNNGSTDLETKIDINSEESAIANDNILRVESKISTDQIDQSIIGTIKNDGKFDLEIKSRDENSLSGSNRSSDIDPTEK